MLPPGGGRRQGLGDHNPPSGSSSGSRLLVPPLEGDHEHRPHSQMRKTEAAERLFHGLPAGAWAAARSQKLYVSPYSSLIRLQGWDFKAASWSYFKGNNVSAPPACPASPSASQV